MEHLPNIKVAESQFPKVPYLCMEEYDGLIWDDYATRRGWDFKRFFLGDFTEHPPQETASFLQNWLFFGTINHILGSNEAIPSTMFLTKDEQGSSWITTARIDEYIRLWAEYVNGLENDIETLKPLMSSMNRCLSNVAILSDILYMSDNCPLPVEVVLSIKVLGCTIESALVWVWNVKSPRKWGLKDIAKSRMLGTGWCLRDICMTSYYLSEITMFYASYVGRDYQRQDHSQCTETLCAVNQIEEDSYRTQHKTEKCQCEHIEPDQEKICEILKNGEVPIISLASKTAPDNSKTIEIVVKSHRTMRWFMAISHVWSDGLGNPKGNSLPLCQVQALYDLLCDQAWEEIYGAYDEIFQDALLPIPSWGGIVKEQLQNAAEKFGSVGRKLVDSVRDYRGKTISIWIDTLCVPLDKEYRRMAIAGLKTVYSKALITIVLDSELQRTSGLFSELENCLRIATSGWMRRAWTFQEGVLSNIRLRAKFADTVVNLSKLIDPNASILRSDGINKYLPHDVKGLTVFERMGKLIGGVEFKADRERMARIAEKDQIKNFSEDFSLAAYITEDTRACFRDMKKVWYIAKDGSNNEEKLQRIIAAWNGLQWRVTSRENDKLFIFAIACITNPKELTLVQDLMQTPAQEQMKMWISQQVCLPEGFLFTKGPRLRELGWRWAPASVHHSAIVHDRCVDRAPADTSLKVVNPGFLISAGDALMGCKVFTFQESEVLPRYRVTLDTENLPAVGGRDVPGMQGLHTGSTLGLVMGKSGIDIKIGSGSDADVKEGMGALIEVISTGDGVVRGSFLCTVDFIIEKSSGTTEDKGVVLARAVKEDQVWIVD